MLPRYQSECSKDNQQELKDSWISFAKRLQDPDVLPLLREMNYFDMPHDEIISGLSTILPQIGSTRSFENLSVTKIHNFNWCHAVQKLSLDVDADDLALLLSQEDHILSSLREIIIPKLSISSDWDPSPLFIFASKRPITNFSVKVRPTGTINCKCLTVEATHALSTMNMLYSLLLNFRQLVFVDSSDMFGRSLATEIPMNSWPFLKDMTLVGNIGDFETTTCLVKAAPKLERFSLRFNDRFAHSLIIPVLKQHCPNSILQ